MSDPDPEALLWSPSAGGDDVPGLVPAGLSFPAPQILVVDVPDRGTYPDQLLLREAVRARGGYAVRGGAAGTAPLQVIDDALEATSPADEAPDAAGGESRAWLWLSPPPPLRRPRAALPLSHPAFLSLCPSVAQMYESTHTSLNEGVEEVVRLQGRIAELSRQLEATTSAYLRQLYGLEQVCVPLGLQQMKGTVKELRAHVSPLGVGAKLYLEGADRMTCKLGVRHDAARAVLLQRGQTLRDDASPAVSPKAPEAGADGVADAPEAGADGAADEARDSYEDRAQASKFEGIAEGAAVAAATSLGPSQQVAHGVTPPDTSRSLSEEGESRGAASAPSAVATAEQDDSKGR